MNPRALQLGAATTLAAFALGACATTHTAGSSSAPGPSRARVFAAPHPAAVTARPQRAHAVSAARTARAFVEAFGFYEVGRTPPAVVAQLRRYATRELVDELLSQPVRLPPDVTRQRARAGRVLLTGTAQPPGQLAGTVERSDGSSMDVTLQRTPAGGWLVTALEPGQLAPVGGQPS